MHHSLPPGTVRMLAVQFSLLCACLVICHVSHDAGLDLHWKLWKTRYGKDYTGQEEEVHRRLVWEKNLRMIEQHNLEAGLGLHSFTMELNHLADMTVEEVDATLNGLWEEEEPVLVDDSRIFSSPHNASLPATVDWRTKGVVSPIRNQGRCGSCWAFSAAAALEGHMKLKTGKMTPLSPQNLIDCSTSYGNHGCKGGYLSKAFTYVIRNKGIDSEQAYPYECRDGKCRYSPKGKAGYCSHFKILPPGNEKVLQYSVATEGPVSVGIDAKLSSFQHYRGGIYNDKNCSQKTNHAVLVVGYGTYKGQDYWLVKNRCSPAFTCIHPTA